MQVALCITVLLMIENCPLHVITFHFNAHIFIPVCYVSTVPEESK